MLRGYAAIGLDNPKTDANVGAALRAAWVFGAAFVAISGTRLKSGCTDTPKAWRHMPFFRPESVLDVIPFDCVLVAVDLIDGAQPLQTYEHPERAYYIFGAEDATLGSQIIDKCRDAVCVPTLGCMNLAACVNVVLYDRAVKRGFPVKTGDGG